MSDRERDMDEGRFEHRLQAAFARAEAELEGDAGFANRVMARLEGSGGAAFNRKRLFILGGAGSVGTAAAGSQLEGLIRQIPMPDGPYAELFLSVGPETIAAAALALPLMLVAWLARNMA